MSEAKKGGTYKIRITYREPGHDKPDYKDYLAVDHSVGQDRTCIRTETSTIIQMHNSDIQTIEISKDGEQR